MVLQQLCKVKQAKCDCTPPAFRITTYATSHRANGDGRIYTRSHRQHCFSGTTTNPPAIDLGYCLGPCSGTRRYIACLHFLLLADRACGPNTYPHCDIFASLLCPG